jgi:hypothetical protein
MISRGKCLSTLLKIDNFKKSIFRGGLLSQPFLKIDAEQLNSYFFSNEVG